MNDFLPRPFPIKEWEYNRLSSVRWPYLDENRWLDWQDIIYQGSRIQAATELEHGEAIVIRDPFVDQMNVRPHSEYSEHAAGELFGTWSQPEMIGVKEAEATLIDGTPIYTDHSGWRYKETQ